MSKKLKTFDLKAALNGEPVLLRDGRKAYVRHYETEQVVDRRGSQLLGIVLIEGNNWTATSWSTQGKWRYEGREGKFDIIGMYPKTRIINGFEVPAPETESPDVYSVFYTPTLSTDAYYGKYEWHNTRQEIEYALKRGLVYLNKEDAVANAKAMLGIDPDV